MSFSPDLDKWSKREQLCLMSAVTRDTSDLDWTTISQAMSLVCGKAKNRPGDWYSQKCCAVQYEHLLQTLESGVAEKSKPSQAEKPFETLLHQLRSGRIQELKAEMQKIQADYTKHSADIEALQKGVLSDEEIREMAREMEQQHETQRIEEMKWENQMREREKRHNQLQQTWGRLPKEAAPRNALESDTTEVDMDVEEIIGVGKTILPTGGSGATRPTAEANVPPVRQAEKPQISTTATSSSLLSSLLKTPPVGAPLATTIAPSSATGVTRATTSAPTITTLLTSGSIPNPTQPLISIKSSLLPTEAAAQLLARPISGPLNESTLPLPTTAAQNLLSPSKSAPTLSMLLEKTKAPPMTATGDTKDQKENKAVDTHKAEQTATSVDAPAEEEMEMELLEEDETEAETEATKVRSQDQEDSNEEQQLLEVFQSIGNIDELDIDVAGVIDDEGVDFLEGVDDDEAESTSVDALPFEAKDEPLSASKGVEEGEENRASKETKAEPTPLPADELKEEAEAKTETTSSDDSNDNIPLAAVASLENKDRGSTAEDEPEEDDEVEETKATLKDMVETGAKHEETDQESLVNVAKDTDETTPKAEDETSSERADESVAEDEDRQQEAEMEETPSSPQTAEEAEMATTASDDEESKPSQEKWEDNASDGLKDEQGDMKREKSPPPPEEQNSDSSDEPIRALTPLEHSSAGGEERPAAATPSMADTDDSSTTDVSIVTRKDDKISSSNRSSLQQQRRGAAEAARQESGKSDDDSTAPPATPAAAPKPIALRKLRDRDRSESPMIDEEQTGHASGAEPPYPNQRLRRRYSSTPVLDAVPDSPASSERDERELRASKKSLLSILNALQPQKHSATFQRALLDAQSSKYDEGCLRQMDLQTIKRNIETGAIRSVYELQRDILWMCQNALMVSKPNSSQHQAVLGFIQECETIREFISNPHWSTASSACGVAVKITSGVDREAKSSGGVKARSNRKSQRFS